jgi:K+-sensing histidine kinase KdpD
LSVGNTGILGNKKLTTKSPTIFISTQLIEKQALISIVDNGVGISKEVRNKIFDPFLLQSLLAKIRDWVYRFKPKQKTSG